MQFCAHSASRDTCHENVLLFLGWTALASVHREPGEDELAASRHREPVMNSWPPHTGSQERVKLSLGWILACFLAKIHCSSCCLSWINAWFCIWFTMPKSVEHHAKIKKWHGVWSRWQSFIRNDEIPQAKIQLLSLYDDWRQQNFLIFHLFYGFWLCTGKVSATKIEKTHN